MPTFRSTAVAALALGSAAITGALSPSSARAGDPDPCAIFVDLGHQLGPARDQGGLGYCFAFAAVTLFEQYACRQRPEECPRGPLGSFSVADAIAQYGALYPRAVKTPLVALAGDPRHTLFSQGGDEGQLLQSLGLTGLCQTRHAPYFNERLGAHGDTEDVIEGVSAIGQLATSLRGLLGAQLTCDLTRGYLARLTALDEPKLDALMRDIQAAVDAKDSPGFLTRLVAPPACANARIRVNPPYRVRYITSREKEEKTPFKRELLAQLKRGRALAVGIELRKLFPEDADSQQPLLHEITVIGAKRVGGRCQVRVRNSWGEDWQKRHHDGWVSLDRLAAAAIDATWLEEESN